MPEADTKAPVVYGSVAGPDPELVMYESRPLTTLTNSAQIVITLPIPGRPGQTNVLVGVWAVVDVPTAGSDAVHAATFISLPDATAQHGPGIIRLAEGWLRNHDTNVSGITAAATWVFTDSLEWTGRIPMRRREERPSDANVIAHFTAVNGATTTTGVLYALVEVYR